MHAETKITMLRMFYDCIDLSSPESDGWQVHEWLKRAFAREKVSISQNSITWLLNLTAKEPYVECSPRIVWSALQHAIRAVLNLERHGRYVERLLQLSENESRRISQQHLSAFAYWIALCVSGRALLPMVIYLGSLLQMKRFDWIEDYMSHRQFLQIQPSLYTAWCHTVLDNTENIEAYMQDEMESSMRQLGWTRDDLLSTLSNTEAASCHLDDVKSCNQVCSQCKDYYGRMPHNLVEPARIAIQECVRTGHDSDCICQNIYKKSDVEVELSDYTGMCCDDYDENQSDVEEDDFFDAQPHLFDSPSFQSQPGCNVFSDLATQLYSAQGRIWIGTYAIGERLCGTCFLLRELYIGEDGFAAEFPRMPKSFESFRTKW
jgi:hypothetical protein